MPGTTTVLSLVTIVGSDTVDLVTHMSTGISQKVEDLLTGAAYPAGNLTIDFNSASNRTFTVKNSGAGVWQIQHENTISPTASDGAALGSSSLMYSDLFLASGAVVNFNAGDVTITHSANTLAFAGAVSGYTFDAVVTNTVSGTNAAILNRTDAAGANGYLALQRSGANKIILGLDSSDGFVVYNSAASPVVNISNGGNVFINDTSNANMTLGLTVNQGAADDEATAWKSSDVAHGMTDDAETDTYGNAKKVSGTDGGFQIGGYSEANRAIQLRGAITTADTTHTAAGLGAIHLNALLKSGTALTSVGANGNLLTVGNFSSTAFIVDAEGDYFSDGTGSTYDAWDDMALVRAFDVRNAFGRWRKEHKGQLVAAGILAPDDAHGNPGFVNWTNMIRLHNGAIRQLYTQMENRLIALEQRLLGAN